MDSDRFQRIEQLVFDALALDDQQRQKLLEEKCDGDDALRKDVESLLCFEHAAEDFISVPAIANTPSIVEDLDLLDPLEQRRLGAYQLISKLGEGGMGSVYLAERADEYEKKVAIKVVRPGFATADLLTRIRNERQILAGLDHPNIAKLLDGGTTDEGSPYIVMDFVEGVPIDEYCDRHKLSINERLALFLDVCSAVAYAHRNLVIHRDIKPSNIIVTTDGAPKLLDFGIAKVLSPDGLPSADQTATLARVMTPQWASPEQVRGLAITTSTDIYTLGVLLYKLLSGHLPYQLKTFLPSEIEKIVCEKQPDRPSAALTRSEDSSTGDATTIASDEVVSGLRSEVPDGLLKQLRGDLDNIVLMAMRKEPERRYSSVEQFSEDIRRHLAGLPVSAVHDTFTYRAGKFVRRHKVGVAATAIVAFTLLTGIIVTSRQARVARAERDRARVEQVRTQRVNAFLGDILKASDPGRQLPNSQKGHEPTIKDALDYAANRVETELSDQPDARAELENIIGDSYLTLGQYDLAEHHLRAALATETTLHGEDNPEAINTLVSLGQLQIAKGETAAAEPIYRRLLDIYRRQQKAGVADAQGFAVVLNDFALMLRQQARFGEAESLLREALGLEAKIPEEMRAVVRLVRTNLALVLADQGDFISAESIYRASIDESRRTPGRERLELAVGLTGLSDTLIAQGKFADAEAALLEGEGIYRKVLGDSHPYLATNLAIQGELNYFKGDYVNAEKKLIAGLDIMKKSVSDGHPRYASALDTLGLVMSKTGRSSKAEAQLRDALEIRKRVLQPSHYLIARTSGALGECLTTEKRYAEAETILRSSYDSLVRSQLPKSPRVRMAIQRLVKLYESWGKSQQAKEFRSKL